MHEAADIAYHPLPALLVLWPLLCALAVRPLGRWREDVRNGFVLFATGVTLLGAAALIPVLSAEHKITSDIPVLVSTLHFVVDPFGMLFALFTTFVWFAATLHALDYMQHEKNRDRFHTTSLVVLGAMLGVVLAGDLITLYLFFEVLGLVAFLFVIHTETEEAKCASVKYLWMTVLGGLALVGGIFLTYALGHTGAIGPIPLEGGTETLRWVTFGLLVLGFGVKAGMLPVHVWLPDAHPVAPSPASALLSGVMIKAGAYGIFRTVTALFRPEVVEEVSEELWHMTSDFGLVVLWIGIATMSIGVVLALGQHNAKRMLAYHSVSQMGFILAGIGAAGYLGSHGAMGVAGGLLHVVNHALFKGALFLGIGAVAFRTGELNMYKLGGLWRKMPWTFVFMLIAAAGITGVPLFNGFVSKCLIHHALVEAYEVRHLMSLDIAEKIYVVTCGGTACSFIKLIGLVFLGTPKTEYGPEVREAPPRMLAALGLLSVAMLVIGIRPHIVLRGVFAPGLHEWALHSDLLEYYLEHYFLSPADLMSVVVAFAIGATIFVVGMKFGLFHLHAPRWFGVDYWYGTFARGFIRVSEWVGGWYERYLRFASRSLRSIRLGYRSTYARVERGWRRTVVTITTGAPGPRNQHFIQNAYIALERERQATVRYAVTRAHEWLRATPDADPARSTAAVDAVRDIASYMATRQMNQRMNVLTDMVRTGEIEAARHSFDDVLAEVRLFRDGVAHTAIELAQRRMTGEDVIRKISAEVNRISSEERFDRRLRVAAAAVHPAIPRVHSIGASARDAMPTPALVTEWRVRGLGRFERASRWVVEIVRLVVETTTQERSSWVLSDRLDPDSIIETRQNIQRYARDMSFNMAMILVVLLVFVLSIAVGVRQ
ncbi:MAG: proton-conducting transporter membrane subunit [Anaerosomatales bacterium]|nr:proton-conducting transporter membrane subunit [Anaerosomatales bacterium]MDT8433996.1 proton-conducting transporter membrane subunit [Anaerosomatales bacterium]